MNYIALSIAIALGVAIGNTISNLATIYFSERVGDDGQPLDDAEEIADMPLPPKETAKVEPWTLDDPPKEQPR